MDLTGAPAGPTSAQAGIAGIIGASAQSAGVAAQRSDDHFLRLHGTDLCLADAAIGFIAAGLEAGEACIILATTPRREAIERKLSEMGLDLRGAFAVGQYVTLDAADTLERLVVEGMPGPERFRSTIGTAIDEASAGGRPVRVFEELGALLWSRRDRGAAIRLEALWRALTRSHSFCLLGACPMHDYGRAAVVGPVAEASAAAAMTGVADRGQAERAPARRAAEQAALSEFTDRLQRASSFAELYDAALDAITAALACDRASILVRDPAGVMRFVAWRGLSDACRRAVEGHSPWQQGDRIPQPVSIRDCEVSELPEALRAAISGEGLRALAFIPLMASGGLTGELMAYYDHPHDFGADELALALTIAHQLSFAADRLRGEDARRHFELEQARLAAIVEASEDAIVSKDLNGIVTSWNAAAERIYGWKAEEIIGRSKGLVIPADLPDELPSILAKVRLGQRIEHYETRRVRKDGTLFDAAISVSPVKGPSGEVVGAATIVRDITAQVRARHEISDLNTRLQRAMVETHHRVKNNLQIIAAMLDLQVMDRRQDETVPVSELVRLGAHVRTLAAVHDALTRHLREEELQQLLPIRSVFTRLIPLLEQAAGSRPIAAEVADVELTGKQATALALVTNELVTNAIKHGSGAITIKLASARAGLTLAVADEGPGFPPGFDLRSSAGTGLQLVSTVVSADLRGGVHFANVRGTGAEVRVTIPRPS